MSYKIIADTFSVARDSDHFILIKTLKNPRSEDQLWVSLEITGETKYARATAQSVIEALEETYFDHFEVEPYERFENALKEINLLLHHLKDKRGPKSVGEISAILAVLAGQELHLTQSKNAEAYLIRKGKLSLISNGLAGKTDDLFVNIASGELLPEDKIIFSTSRLLRLATHSQLVQIFGDGVTEAIDSIRELVMNDHEISLGVACLNTKLPARVPSTAAGAKLAAVAESPVVQKIKAFFQKHLNTVTEKVSEKMGSLSGRKPEVDKKTILAVIGGVVVLLVVSIMFLMNSNRTNAIRAEYKVKIDSMNQDLQVANTKGYANDKETANAILDKVEKEGRDVLNTSYFRAEALDVIQRVQASRDSINNTTRFKDLKPYVDLTAKKAQAMAIGLLSLGDNFYAYEFSSLYEIILDQVLAPKAIDATELVTTGTALDDQGLLVFLTQSGKIIEYEKGQFHLATTDDSSWQAATGLAAYGKYLYLLSPAKNQIYKYARLRDKYSSGSEYNVDGDLSGAVSMAIDGNVYILKNTGAIVKLFKSKAQAFEIQGLPVNLSDATKIFTSPEINHLYILEPAAKRVLVVEKDKNGIAKYKSQIIFDDLNNLQDLYVDKKEDKMTVLTSTALYQIKL